MQRRKLFFMIAVTMFIGIPFATGFSNDGAEERALKPRTVVGGWTLTTARDRSGRNVEFRVENQQVVGTYFTQSGEGKLITNTRFTHGRFFFEVPDLKLYFDVGMVQGRLEGAMTAYSEVEKRVPEPVVLTRR